MKGWVGRGRKDSRNEGRKGREGGREDWLGQRASISGSCGGQGRNGPQC